MRESDQRFKAENAGAALDRMNAAEHRIDRVVRALALADIGEPSLDLLQGFVAFVEERLL